MTGQIFNVLTQKTFFRHRLIVKEAVAEIDAANRTRVVKDSSSYCGGLLKRCFAKFVEGYKSVGLKVSVQF